MRLLITEFNLSSRFQMGAHACKTLNSLKKKIRSQKFPHEKEIVIVYIEKKKKTETKQTQKHT